MAANQASEKGKIARVFGQARKPAKMFRAGLYARVSTNDQETIRLQIRALREYAVGRGSTIACFLYLRLSPAESGRKAPHFLVAVP